MRIIDVIESRCGCKVKAVKVDFRGGSRVIYASNIVSANSYSKKASLCGIDAEITYCAPKDIDKSQMTFMIEMLECFLENQEFFDFQDTISRVADIPAGSASLEHILELALNALIFSHLFDKCAVLFLNENKMELRGVLIASTPPYGKDQLRQFKNISTSIRKETVDELIEKEFIKIEDDKIFNLVEKDKLSNHLIFSPLIAGSKVYGILVTYSPNEYDEKHTYASKSTARLVSSIISATLVYRKYNLSVLSEKELAEKLKETSEMAFLGTNTANIAHEIKNPLIAIGGFAKRLMKAVVDPNLQQMAKIIFTESERLERLTIDILSFSKKQEPHKLPICLHEEIEGIKLLFAQRSGETKIDINIDIDKKVVISVDPHQFRQVVVNLVANAMNAVGKNGNVSIKLEEDKNHKNYLIKIADTGPGIPEALMPKLFTPFFTTSPNGTGLGLPISKKIMINHGGDILVRNYETGAEFTLVIPKQA